MSTTDIPVTQSTAPVPKIQDLEIKDAQLIFNSIFHELEEEYSRENLCFPGELILLGGAPGAGKGTNTEFILKQRDITAPPIVVSALLNTPEAQKIKDAGGMVGDKEVIGILFKTLLNPIYQNGALLDGFPRTKIQVECLKLLHEKMSELQREFDGTEKAVRFRRPMFHIVMLFVEEKESINRQLKRGREIKAHNEEVRLTGIGELLEERSTDTSIEPARKRYQVFKEKTYDALQSLKALYHYHFINAHGPLSEVQERIVEEFQYQSALELDPRTYAVINELPLASELTSHARQELVRRLDSYEITTPEMLRKVVDFIACKMMPIIERHAISGQANINSEEPLLHEPHVLSMLIDVMSERGFHTVADIHRIEIPNRVDLKTGEVRCREKLVYRFIVRFKGSEIRRG
jgi:adenylate kinase